MLKHFEVLDGKLMSKNNNLKVSSDLYGTSVSYNLPSYVLPLGTVTKRGYENLSTLSYLDDMVTAVEEFGVEKLSEALEFLSKNTCVLD